MLNFSQFKKPFIKPIRFTTLFSIIDSGLEVGMLFFYLMYMFL